MDKITTLDEFNEKLKILKNDFVKSKLEQYDKSMKDSIVNIRLQCTIFFGFLGIFQLFQSKSIELFYFTIDALLLGILILTAFIAMSEFNYRLYKFKINEIYKFIKNDNYNELYSKLIVEEGFDRKLTFKFFPKLTGLFGGILAFSILSILPIDSNIYFKYNFITLFIILQFIFFVFTVFSYYYNSKNN